MITNLPKKLRTLRKLKRINNYDSIHDGPDILVKWRNRTGSKRLSKGIKTIEKEMPNQYRYLKKWDLIKQDKDSRSVDIKYKG